MAASAKLKAPRSLTASRQSEVSLQVALRVVRGESAYSVAALTAVRARVTARRTQSFALRNQGHNPYLACMPLIEQPFIG
jgi:hypothetical protein